MEFHWKRDTAYIVKASLLFCSLSAAFSLAGLMLPEKTAQPNPTGGLNIHEIGGHLLWGLVPGAAFLSVRYAITTGLFAVLIDSDHLVALLHVEALSRMSHSIAFGAIAVVILLLVFGRKDYRLGATAFAGLLAHISFDTFAGEDGKFPLFTPFYNHQIVFPNSDWIVFEAIAVAIAVLALALSRRKIALAETA